MRRFALLLSLALFGCPQSTDSGGVVDEDGDGSPAGVDCDDGDGTRFPEAPEACNGLDDDCDGSIDNDGAGETWPDEDGDGYGAGTTPGRGCPINGWVAVGGDCDDDRAAVHPGADDPCDGLDSNCDGAAEVELGDWFTDADGDGYGDDATVTETCTPAAGAVALGGDCADDDPAVSPGAPELCNSADDNCDGQADLGVEGTWHSDDDGDGFGSPLATEDTCTPPLGWVEDGTDCRPGDPLAFPGAPEQCNGVDDSCEGEIDEGFDADGDGFQDAVCPAGDDCDDHDNAIFPGQTEICGDGVDDDCDGADVHCGFSGAYATADAELTITSGGGELSGYMMDHGDLDGDGTEDLVSAYYSSGTIAFGPLVGSGAWTDFDSVTWTDGRRTGTAGRSIGVADVDGDGQLDLGIGAPDGTVQGSFVTYGPITGNLDLDNCDAVFSLVGSGQGGHGMAMGDVTGDGVGDVIMGDYYGNSMMGAVYVAFGPLTEDRDSDDADATLSGEVASGYAGRFIRTADGGDLDGDGVGDFLVAAPYASEGAPTGGVVYVILGPPSDMSLADAQARIIGDSPSDMMGEQRAMDLGDVDGDGLVDVASSGATTAATYIFEGTPSGDYAASDADIILASASVSDSFGDAVTLDDVDGDGRADVLGGAPGMGGGGAGGAYFFFAPSPGSYTTADADASFTGGSQAGFSVTLVDLDTDGHLDVAVGSPSDPNAILGFTATW